MRVMTFNVQHCQDFLKKVIDVDLFAEAIRKQNVDICCLNEVYNEGPRECNTDQSGYIAEKLGFYPFFGEAIKTRGENPYGIAMVSRFAFKSVEKIDILDCDTDKPRFEHRCIIKAIVEVEGRDVCVLTSHFGLNDGEKKSAVETVCSIIDKCDCPVVLTGDFNMQPDNEILRPLFERLKDTTEFDKGQTNTFRSDEPTRKIDYILYKGFECVSCKTVNEIYADHLPIVAEFKF